MHAQNLDQSQDWKLEPWRSEAEPEYCILSMLIKKPYFQWIRYILSQFSTRCLPWLVSNTAISGFTRILEKQRNYCCPGMSWRSPGKMTFFILSWNTGILITIAWKSYGIHLVHCCCLIIKCFMWVERMAGGVGHMNEYNYQILCLRKYLMKRMFHQNSPVQHLYLPY